MTMGNTVRWSRRHFLKRAARLGAGAVAASCGGRAAATVPVRTSSWRIGCYTRPWANDDYRSALDAIAEAGFKHAGLMTTKSETGLVISTGTKAEEAVRVGEEARSRGLSVVSVYGGEIPIATSLNAGIAGLQTLIDRCAACRAETLLMGGMADPDLYEAYYRAIRECCDYAADKGVGITLKPHGGLNATGPQCRKAVEKVRHGNFRLWYDPGNILYYSDGQRDPVTDADTVSGLVTGMCVKDYLDPKNVLVTPGTGRVDFAGVLDRLAQGGFAGGPLVIECLSPGDLNQTIAEAKKARKFLERLTASDAPP